MSRRLAYDTHAGRDLQQRRALTERAQSPSDLLLNAAGLLENFGHASSECRATAEKLRQMARLLARAEAAEAAARRHEAEAQFRRPR